MKANTFVLMVTAAMVCCVGLPKANATVYFDDGGTHTVNWEIPTHVEVREDAFFGNTTTLDLVSGGVAMELGVYDSSQVSVCGGIVTGSLYAHDSSQLTISSGEIWDSVRTSDESQATISGGQIRCDLTASGASQMTVYGAHIGGALYIGMSSGPTDSAVLTLVGSDFAINGTPVPYGEYDANGNEWVHGTLTGTFVNAGYPLDHDFFIYENSRLVLAPEPATMALLLGGLAMVRRRR